MKLEKEKEAIFEDLLNFIIWEKDYLSKTAKLQRNFSKIEWQKRFGIGFLFLFLCATVLLLGSKQIILSRNIDTTEILGWTVLTLYSISLIFLVLFIIALIKKPKNFKNSTYDFFNRIKNKSITLDKEIVSKLGNSYHQESLKSVEQDFEDETKRLQASKEIIAVLSPILASLIVVFTIFNFGIPEQLLKTSFVYGAVSGVPGFIALVLAVLNFYREFLLQPNITRCNKCISILKKAQIVIDKSEDSNNLEQPKRGNKKPSLLKRLQNISIEGPEDFAANHDMYISGEKRIEPDIR